MGCLVLSCFTWPWKSKAEIPSGRPSLCLCNYIWRHLPTSTLIAILDGIDTHKHVHQGGRASTQDDSLRPRDLCVRVCVCVSTPTVTRCVRVCLCLDRQDRKIKRQKEKRQSPPCGWFPGLALRILSFFLSFYLSSYLSLPILPYLYLIRLMYEWMSMRACVWGDWFFLFSRCLVLCVRWRAREWSPFCLFPSSFSRLSSSPPQAADRTCEQAYNSCSFCLVTQTR